MAQSKQLKPNTLAKNLSDEVLQAKHEAEQAVSKFIKLFNGCDYNFKLLDADYLSDKVLIDFSSTHISDNFFLCGRKSKNHTTKTGGQY
mgnify:CR=1 FL=1